jgi:hypothetical protein
VGPCSKQPKKKKKKRKEKKRKDMWHSAESFYVRSCFETGSDDIAQVGLELEILLPLVFPVLVL